MHHRNGTNGEHGRRDECMNEWSLIHWPLPKPGVRHSLISLKEEKGRTWHFLSVRSPRMMIIFATPHGLVVVVMLLLLGSLN